MLREIQSIDELFDDWDRYLDSFAQLDRDWNMREFDLNYQSFLHSFQTKTVLLSWTSDFELSTRHPDAQNSILCNQLGRTGRTRRISTVYHHSVSRKTLEQSSLAFALHFAEEKNTIIVKMIISKLKQTEGRLLASILSTRFSADLEWNLFTQKKQQPLALPLP